MTEYAKDKPADRPPVRRRAPRDPRLLVVDDDELLRDSVQRWLARDHYNIRTAASGDEALRLMARRPAEIVISDLFMPGMDGLELLRRLREAHPGVCVLIMTGHAEMESALAALRGGAFDYLLKPLDLATVRHTVGRAATQIRMRQQLDDAHEKLQSAYQEIQALNRELRHRVVRSEREAQETFRRYREIFEGSLDGIVFVDLRGQIVDCNEAYQRMLGYTLDELRGRHYNDFTPPRWHATDRMPGLLRDLRQGKPFAPFEKEYQRKDGTVFPVELTPYLLRNERGRPHMVWSVVRDITERKQAEAALRTQRDHWQTIIQRAPFIVCGLAPDGATRFVNPLGEQLLGYTAAELAGRPWWDVFYPGADPQGGRDMLQLFATSPVRDYETLTPTRQGERRVIAWTAVQLRAAGGDLVEILMFGNDITERKRQEALLALQRELALQLSELTSMDAALDVLLRYTLQSATLSCGGVYLADDAGGLHLQRSAGLDGGCLASLRHLAPDSGLARAARQGQPGFWQGRDLASLCGPGPELGNIRALALLPVQHHGRLLGCILAACPADAPFSRAIRQSLEMIASQTGGVIRRLLVEAEGQRDKFFLQSVLKTSPSLIIIYDFPAHHVAFVNDAVMTQLDYSPEEILALGDQAAPRLIEPSDRVRLIETLARFDQPDAPDLLPTEFRLRHKNGQWRWMTGRIGVFSRDAHGRPQRFINSVIDITERHRIEEIIRLQRDLAQVLHTVAGTEEALQHGLTMAMVVSGMELGAVYGGLPERPDLRLIVGQGFPDKAPRARLRPGGADPARLVCAGRGVDLPFFSDDQLRAAGIRGRGWIPILHAGQVLAGLLLGSREQEEMPAAALPELEAVAARVGDVLIRLLAQDELRRTGKQLRALAHRLQTIREEERRTIAREFHDDIGQQLTALKIDIERLLHALSAEGARVPRRKLLAHGNAMLQQVMSLMDRARNLAMALTPNILGDLGLVGMIEWEARNFEARTGVACQFTAAAGELGLEKDRAIALFRIVQEALTNIIRHARASRVEIRLQRTPDNLELEVRDNGAGISRAAARDPRAMGLLGMRERALMCGGAVEISGRPGQGTTVRFTMPLVEPGGRPC